MRKKALSYMICMMLIFNTLHTIEGLWTQDYSITNHDDASSWFDFIVVGAGAGGAAAATRLALAGRSVLLIEAGDTPPNITRVPGLAQGLLASPIDWAYTTESNNMSCLSSNGDQCRFSRGKCLGGSTSINYMLYVRGNRIDFDSWNVPGWSYEDVLPYFLRYEGLRSLGALPESSTPYHNTDGIVDIEFFANSHNLWHDRLFRGYHELGVPFNPDCNAREQIGVTQSIGYVYENERMSTHRAFLDRPHVTKGLNVTKNALCTKLIIDENNVVQGVTFKVDSKYYNVYARNEVILSAGTIGTPQILMLSGIGPHFDLTENGIDVKVDLPVGKGMLDHVISLVFMQVKRGFNSSLPLNSFTMQGEDIIQYLLNKTGPLASNGLTDVVTFLNSDCYDRNKKRLIWSNAQCSVPSVQMIHAYIDKGLIAAVPLPVRNTLNFKDDVFTQILEANAESALIIFSPVVLSPASKGYITLKSKDPTERPFIYPNYLYRESDVDELVRAIRIIEDLAETTTFVEGKAKLVHLKLKGCTEEPGSEAYWRCYTRHTTFSVYHATSTASLGPVLDERLRVRGVSRLRVADLSAVPRIPRGNTEAISVAIGERVADFILD